MANRDSLLVEFLIVGVLLGSLLALGGCADKAKRADEAMVHYQISQQLVLKDESTQALSEGLKALELDPKNAEIQHFVALLYLQRRDTEKAESHFRKAIKLDPKYSDARNNLCNLLAEKGRYDEAIRQCTEAIQNVTYATPERAYHNMGVIYERKGDLPKAVESYKKGLIHNKNFVKSLRNLSNIYLATGQKQEALPLLESASKACTISPKGAWGADCPEVHYQLAMLYVQTKQRSRVISELKECVNADDEKGAYGQKCRKSLTIYR